MESTAPDGVVEGTLDHPSAVADIEAPAHFPPFNDEAPPRE